MKPTFRSLLTVAALALTGLTTCQLAAADWPQWRGPHRDGQSTETGLLPEWPKAVPQITLAGQGHWLRFLHALGRG